MTRLDIPNLPKWIRASIIKHCVALVPTLQYDIKIDNYVDVYELNPGDIDIDEVSYEQHVISTTLMLMIYVKKSSDLYKIDKFISNAMKCFTPSISVYKLGGDSGEQIGCLVLDGTVTTNRLGSQQNDKTINQALIRADYKMEI